MKRLLVAIYAGLVPDRMLDSILAAVRKSSTPANSGGDTPHPRLTFRAHR